MEEQDCRIRQKYEIKRCLINYTPVESIEDVDQLKKVNFVLV